METRKEQASGHSDAANQDADKANRALCDLNEVLDQSKGADTDVLVTVEGNSKTITLPKVVAETLRVVLANTAAGRAVAVIPSHAWFTTQQAADMLNVSRPYLIKLLDEDRIEYRKIGTHRRILASSLREYERQMELDSKQAADDLAVLSEELGLYE